MISKSSLCACLLTALLLSIGCGDGKGTRYPTSGVVSVDGVPLEFGSLVFMPVKEGDAKTRPGSASLSEGGTYNVSSYKHNDGLLKGKYEVMISAIEPINDASQRWHAPPKYANTETSGLVVEISEANDELIFELSWDGEKKKAPYVERF